MRAADKLQVLMDAEQIHIMNTDLSIRDEVTVRATEPQAVMSGVWVEPYTKTALMIPKQFADDFHEDSSVPRYAKDDFTGLTAGKWDEITRDAELWLLSDGTDETIATITKFGKNSGFVVDFIIYGPETDRFRALQLEFGQWRLDVWSNGEVILLLNGFPAAKGSLLDGHSAGSLCNIRSQLLIMPSGGGTLFVRRNRVAGFSYPVPDYDPATPVIIEANHFSLTAPGGMVMFQLTELAYPTTGDFYYITPARQLPKPPVTGQTFTTVTDEETDLGGGIGVSLQMLDDPDLPVSYDNVIPFVADDVADTYYVLAIFNADVSGKHSAMFRGLKIGCAIADPEESTIPSDITADVVECSINVGDNPFETDVQVTIKEVDDHPILGKCNRRVCLKIGSTIIFDGLLAEPPTLSYDTKGLPRYSLAIKSVGAKMADQPCLPGNVRFDNVQHVEAVTWFCQFIGIPTWLMEFDVDDTPLRDSRTGQDKAASSLETSNADTPRQWIEKICEESQWWFIDGPMPTGGGFGYRYVDPLAMSATPTHTFYALTKDSLGEDAYDLLRSLLKISNIEPEGNEIHVIGQNANGEIIDALYEDLPAQDYTLVEVDEENPENVRPKNWLGFRKIVVIPIQGVIPEAILTALARSIGGEISKVCQMAEFEAVWKPGLWRGSVVTIDVGSSGLLGGGDYRIEKMDLKFEGEGPDYPVRRATYTATKLETGYAARARSQGNLRLAKQIGYYLRYGPQQKQIMPTTLAGTPGHHDAAGNLGALSNVTRVIRVNVA